MAGYSMASPISPNHSQRKLLKQNRFRNDNIDRFSIVHPLNSKVIKSKYKTKVSVMSSEREEYIKKFLNIHINDKIKTPKNDHKFAVFHNSHEKVPISKYEKLFTRQSPEIPHTSLLDIVKSKGLTTFNAPTNVSDSIENKFDKSCRLQDQNSPKNHDYPKIISRVNREENWLLPEESTQFKKVMENNFEMIYKNKHNKIIDTHVNNIRENHFTEKVNLLSLIKSDRKKISLSMRVKGFFSSFPTLNLKSSLRKYIPYKFLDVDDNLKVPGKEEFVEFTEEMEKEILTILRSQNQLIVTAFSINIHTKDLITLCGTNWLNDSVWILYTH
ncbi:hypothetical protein RDWZM_004025 [Blomia tropicalis]|uniref:Uncharacterized protein n=1 Tax=Blomia tropicalis TaxID=40697 RepID=A0A9Q0MGB9_BLOTA|nr:hypothetical protein RDWZM_004025 [Blomia tropicalis]